MKTKNNYIIAAIIFAVLFIGLYQKQQTSQPSDLAIANIEALSDGEVVVVGCKRQDGSTCYVFSDGNLIDKRKNQYPGVSSS